MKNISRAAAQRRDAYGFEAIGVAPLREKRKILRKSCF